MQAAFNCPQGSPMSWKLTEKLRATLAAEAGGVPVRRGATLSFCLVYPNRYRTAMGNLGFQAVHALLNEIPGILCERAFLPEADELQEYRRSGTPLLSLESQ